MKHLYRIVFIVLLATIAAQGIHASDNSKVTVVTIDYGETLWLPAGTTPSAVNEVTGLYLKYKDTYSSLFGREPLLPDPLIVINTSDLKDGLFNVLWRYSSEALRPVDRGSAFSALRSIVLDDPSSMIGELSRISESGSLTPGDTGTVLGYLFLKETLADKSLMPQMLPPGQGGQRLIRKFAEKGISSELLMNRFAAWVFSKSLEAKIIDENPGTLPAAWVIDRDLAPGGFTSWNFKLADLEEGINIQSALKAPPGFRLFSFYTDGPGRITRIGIGNLSTRPIGLPKGGNTLWLILWNGGSEKSGFGLTMTLWKNFSPPFVLRDLSRKGRTCNLLLEEGSGISDYRVSARKKEEHPDPRRMLPPFPSLGEGLHSYRLKLPDAYGDLKLNLSCTMSSGGFYTVPLEPGKKSDK